MLYRSTPPNLHRWNGLGGKCEADDTPLTCVRRAVWEEAGIDVEAAHDIYFGGIVTWPAAADPTGPGAGDAYEYDCDYRGGHLAAVAVRPLSPAVLTYCVST
jgi:8-oxo-dGTP diphosphatase